MRMDKSVKKKNMRMDKTTFPFVGFPDAPGTQHDQARRQFGRAQTLSRLHLHVFLAQKITKSMTLGRI